MKLTRDELLEMSTEELEVLLIKEQMLDLQCNTIQLGLKITLNSCYGYLGNQYSRFYNIDLAEAITLNGQLANKWIQRKINSYLSNFLKTDTKDFVIMGDSVVADSKLIVDGDYVEIQDLFGGVDEVSLGKEYHYPNELMALTYDESNHKTCYKKVKYVVRHKVDKKIFKTSITNQQSITTTNDHSLITYVNTSKRRSSDNSVFTETKPYEVSGKSLIHLTNIPRTCDITSKDYPTEIYELLGLFLADGSKDGLNISISVGKQDVDEISSKLFDKLVSHGYSTSYKTRPNGHDVILYGKKLLDITGHCYENNKKVVPKFLKSESIENISAFLRGYFTGDGTVLDNVSACSIDVNIIKDVKLLLFYCGVESTYFKETTENSYNGVYSGSYSHKITVRGDFAKINFLLDRKNSKIKPQGKSKQYFKEMGYDFGIASVTDSVEIFDYDDYVYDVEIEDTHTFFANDILVHNTDSCYITLKEFADKLPTEDKHKIVRAIDRFCNAKISPEIDKGYDELANMINSYKQTMEMEREVIADRAVVRAKKNYCLNVYNSEGVAYDEPKLKIMGLESVRSSTPEICRNAIKHTLKLIMTSDEETTQKYIAKFKAEFMAAPVEDIAFPRGINDIDKWELETPKLGVFMSKTPIHVKAAITYNLLLEQHGLDKISPIRTGTKVKFVYLKAQNTARNNAIAFDGVLPVEFNLHKSVDRRLQYTKSYLDPIISIISLAKWTPEKKANLTSFFGSK